MCVISAYGVRCLWLLIVGGQMQAAVYAFGMRDVALATFRIPDLTSNRPATSSVHYTTNCNTQSSAPEDG